MAPLNLPRLPSTVLGLTWRQHIGGRWAVSSVGFAVVAPISFLAVFINVQRFATTDLALWALASASSLAVMGLMWWLASVTVLKNRRVSPVAVWVVSAVGFVTGAVRSIIATSLTVEWGLFPAPGGLAELLPARGAVGGLQGAVGLPVLAMLLSLVDRYRTERSRLLSQLAGIQERRVQEAGAAAALRDALSGPVQARLRELADRLGQDASGIGAVASDVRSQAHELWSQSQVASDPPRVRVRDVLRISLSIRPLPLAAVWMVWMPPAVLTLVSRNSVGMALGQVASGAVILTVVYMLGGIAVRRLRGLGAVVFVVGTIGGAALAGIVMLLLVGGRLSDANISLIVVSTFWLVSVTLVVSIIESAVLRSEQVLAELVATIDTDEVALHQEQQARNELAQEVAGVLHGVVQGRLAVAQRADSDSVTLARRALDEGIERLASSPTATTIAARDLVEQVCAPWTALMQIDIDARGADVSGAHARDIGDVLEECLSNAFRHGEATTISIIMSEVSEGWRLRVESNGRGPSDRAATGMGSSLFDFVSGGNWSREAVAQGGCLVTVHIPTD